MPLGKNAELGPDDIVLDGNPTTPQRDTPQIFGPRVLWPNGCHFVCR